MFVMNPTGAMSAPTPHEEMMAAPQEHKEPPEL